MSSFFRDLFFINKVNSVCSVSVNCFIFFNIINGKIRNIIEYKYSLGLGIIGAKYLYIFIINR